MSLALSPWSLVDARIHDQTFTIEPLTYSWLFIPPSNKLTNKSVSSFTIEVCKLQ